MKILLSGGGTLGPVMPLLAISEACKKQPDLEAEFVWVGTQNGPEKKIVESYNIPFFVIASGKLRRYFSFFNFIDFFKIIFAFFQSFYFLWKEKPDLLISAGGFVSVPLHWAAFLMGIPTWIHQQDVRLGLANKLMAKTAKKITVALRDGLKYFPENKSEWIGNPTRDLSWNDVALAKEKLEIPLDSKVVFALGGGTGSARLNDLIVEALPHLPKNCHVIHLLGNDRDDNQPLGAKQIFGNYHPYNFFTEEMKWAYAAADVVVARAGFCTISELASLSKPAIFLPMAETHQEDNVRLLASEKACVVLDERKVDGLKLAGLVKEILRQPEVGEYMGKRLHAILPPADPKKILEIVSSLTGRV